MFCNAFEFMEFNEKYCCTCKKYVPYNQATDDNPVCSIEENIAIAVFDATKFPHDQVKRDAHNGRPYCNEWEE